MRLCVAIAVTVSASAVVIAAAPAATAATNTNTRHSFTVKTPSSKTVKAGKKALIRPRVSVPKSKQRATLSVTISAYRNGHQVAHGKTVRLKPGTYKTSVKVKWASVKSVRRTHTVRVTYPGGYTDNASCIVREIDGTGDYILRSDCTSRAHPGAVAHDTYTLAHEPAPYYVGERVTGDFVNFPTVTRNEVRPYMARVYGHRHTFTTPKRSLVVRAKAKHRSPAPPATHSCTTTSSGSCIQGGEFCPRASYGQSGYDADGDRYVCEGDSDHPHWMIP